MKTQSARLHYATSGLNDLLTAVLYTFLILLLSFMLLFISGFAKFVLHFCLVCFYGNFMIFCNVTDALG